MLSTLIPKNSIWLLYSSENNDPIFKKYITSKTIASSIAIITENTEYLVVSSLDYDNVKDKEKVFFYNNKKEFLKTIEKIIKELNYPKSIFLNYSLLDQNIDILGYGTYIYLTSLLNRFYKKVNKKVNYKSSENIICALIDKKTTKEITYMTLAANRALEILEETFKKIKIGMTEKEIANLVHSIFNKKPDYFKEYKITNEFYGWEKKLCPIVLVGPSLLKGGHAISCDQTLEKGHTIYFDFGVTLEFEDGKYSSDIQRMGYVLKDNEPIPPKAVQEVFDTLINAIDLGMKNCTPDKKGYEIDNIVRNYVLNKGYPDYNHGTGHPVGELVHNPGTILSKGKKGRTNLFLQENGVYTIEPRIAIDNGGSIEEMILVTKNGGVPLCNPQKELYIIK